jgi:hypothetical protein
VRNKEIEFVTMNLSMYFANHRLLSWWSVVTFLVHGKPTANVKGTQYKECYCLQKLATNTHDLNIPRYVEPKVTSDVLTVEEVMQRLIESAETAFVAAGQFLGILQREGLLD